MNGYRHMPRSLSFKNDSAFRIKMPLIVYTWRNWRK